MIKIRKMVETIAVLAFSVFVLACGINMFATALTEINVGYINQQY